MDGVQAGKGAAPKGAKARVKTFSSDSGLAVLQGVWTVRVLNTHSFWVPLGLNLRNENTCTSHLPSPGESAIGNNALERNGNSCRQRGFPGVLLRAWRLAVGPLGKGTPEEAITEADLFCFVLFFRPETIRKEHAKLGCCRRLPGRQEIRPGPGGQVGGVCIRSGHFWKPRARG